MKSSDAHSLPRVDEGSARRSAAAFDAEMAAYPSSPRLTIGLPVFNGAKFLDACLESITSQTFRDFRLIICDNASTDETPQIAERWCARDSRISLHRAPENRGAAANFNWAFELANSELFKWCAVDDLMHPAFLAACIAALDANPQAVLAYTGTIDIDEQGHVLGEIYDNNAGLRFESEQVELRFRDLVCAGHSCISVFGVIRTRALRRSSLIGPYVASDKVLLAELGLQGRFVKIADNLLLHRQHKARSVTENPSLQARAAWFNARAQGKVFPHFRLAREYVRAVLTAPLPWSARGRCLIEVLRWFHWDGRQGMLDDLRYYCRRSAKT